MQVPVTSSTPTTLAEIFPVNVSALPPLTAYQVKATGGDSATIGGKLAYRLQKALPGHWTYSKPWIITDTPPSDEVVLTKVVEQAWRDDPTVFRGLVALQRLATWQPAAQAHADFVARCLWPELRLETTRLLNTWGASLGGMVQISRLCEVRGWVVQGEPALSISLESRLLTKQDVQTYLKNASSPQAVIDLLVADRESTLKGVITSITGPVKEHRGRLSNLAETSPSLVHIQAAADNETVVQVYATNRSPYEYVARGLQIIVRTADYARFHVNGHYATAQLRLAPQKRSDMMSELARLAKQKGFIGNAYSSKRHSHLFLTSASITFTPGLTVGKRQRLIDIRDRSVQTSLQRNGFYKRVTPDVDTPIRIGVLNGLPKVAPTTFLTLLQEELRRFAFQSEITATEVVTLLERHDLERAVHSLHGGGAHLLLALFPDALTANVNETTWGPYDHFKSLTIGNDIPSQVVHQSTMTNTHALGNIVLGMLSKLGNIPYVLSAPLPYADIVVGIDIARRRKTKLAGSLNATAIARIYQNTGEFLQYVIHDAQLEGETIPADVLRSLFPANIFAGKRVVIHRDGLFRGNEKQVLKEWAARLGAQFFLVELLKTGTPRLYQSVKMLSQEIAVQQPMKGSAFKLNNQQAFLVSSLPPFQNVTPYPIHVRSEAPFPIEEALHSVLSLTLLHYGSLRPPRLPVTIHYSDEIAYLALKGIKPKSLEGSLPFWL